MKKIELKKDAKACGALHLRKGMAAYAILKDGKLASYCFQYGKDKFRWMHINGSEADILAQAAAVL